MPRKKDPAASQAADAAMWEAVDAADPKALAAALADGANPGSARPGDWPELEGQAVFKLAHWNMQESSWGRDDGGDRPWECIEMLARAGADMGSVDHVNRSLVKVVTEQTLPDKDFPRGYLLPVKRLALVASLGAPFGKYELGDAFRAGDIDFIEALCAGQGGREMLRREDSLAARQLLGWCGTLAGGKRRRGLEALIRAGADADRLLPEVFMHQRSWMIPILAEAGVDLDRERLWDGKFGTPLAHAMEHGYRWDGTAPAMELLRAGAKPNPSKPSKSPARGVRLAPPLAAAKALSADGKEGLEELIALLERAELDSGSAPAKARPRKARRL